MSAGRGRDILLRLADVRQRRGGSIKCKENNRPQSRIQEVFLPFIVLRTYDIFAVLNEWLRSVLPNRSLLPLAVARTAG
ncbi:hypothetical protein KC344_g76 [Hortaea werneckii]|nr:hypothetical protein KC344_g76 [Hortaea werneckii]